MGSISNDIFSANLNPEYVDNNVFLNGTMAGDQITGQWIYAGYPGILNQGTFTTEK